jgi:hypothetical protein
VGACLGITLANGVFIVAAFGGVAVLRPGSALFIAVQLAGCAYLLYLGWLFLRHAGRVRWKRWPQARRIGAPAWAWDFSRRYSIRRMRCSMSAWRPWSPAGGPGGGCHGYGAWMVCAVLAWDMAVALAIGNAALRQRFARALPGLERLSGIMLILLAAALLANVASSARKATQSGRQRVQVEHGIHFQGRRLGRFFRTHDGAVVGGQAAPVLDAGLGEHGVRGSVGGQVQHQAGVARAGAVVDGADLDAEGRHPRFPGPFLASGFFNTLQHLSPNVQALLDGAAQGSQRRCQARIGLLVAGANLVLIAFNS